MNAYKVAGLAAVAGIAATLALGFASTNDTPAPTSTEQPVAASSVDAPTPVESDSPAIPTPADTPVAAPSVDPTAIPAPTTPTCAEGWHVAEDGSCVNPHYYDTPIDEDSPEWDCRTMGNLTCGVQIQGTWYNITFANGSPVSVKIR